LAKGAFYGKITQKGGKYALTAVREGFAAGLGGQFTAKWG